MSAGFTAGPWKWDDTVWDYDPSETAPWIVSDDANESRVLWGEVHCNEANARLIASAPELLEALQDALAALAENVGMQDTYIDFDQVRAARDKSSAAIAKATGETT